MKKSFSGRRFLPSVPNHVYQITADCGVLFYKDEDYLVFLAVLFTVARRKKVRIFNLCLMINHIHLQVSAPSERELDEFMRDFTSWFSRRYNKETGRSGRLFKISYGSAPKKGRFALLDNHAYILNNPVAKSICGFAAEYRWNLLPYLVSDNPFSEKYSDRISSPALKTARSVVESSARRGLAISYEFCRLYSEKLEEREWRQLEDYIICLYNTVDYGWIDELYGSVENLFSALRNTSGKESDMEEDRDSRDYRQYYHAIDLLEKHFSYDKGRFCPYALNGSQVRQAVRLLGKHTSANVYQIARLLHVSHGEVSAILYNIDYQ